MSTETASAEITEAPAAETPPTAATVADRPRLKPAELIDRWYGVATRANAMLRDPVAAQFGATVQRADDEIAALVESESDGSLLLLVHMASADVQRYSVMHALLVALVCDLAARALPECSTEQRSSLRKAALTMNIGMTRLQDQLAVQDGEVSADQRALIDGHAARSHEMLQEMGVSDELWLQAVLHHHDAPPGALSEQPMDIQLARLIRRADMFSARMSPRKMRAAQSATVAAKGAYFDEREQPDPAGSLVIKALGIYPAGSYVQLANGELGIVLRPGAAFGKPLVAGIADADGSPYVQPMLRTTDTKATAIVRGVPPKDIKVRVSIERLLKMAR